MGQGSDSCGGYEVDYDEYEEGLEEGMWTQRDHRQIHVSKMSARHLINARALAEARRRSASFTDEADKWQAWIDIFDSYIEIAERTPTTPKVSTPPKPVRGKKVTMICHCKAEYEARQADLNRGNGLSCSKRCAAIRREFKRPPAKPKTLT